MICVFLAGTGLLTQFGCGGGGGGSSPGISGSNPDEIALLSITFPDSVDLTGGSSIPPEEAPLSQQIVFTFSGAPQGPISFSSINIYADIDQDYNGPECVVDWDKGMVPARGTYEIYDNIVVFNPTLPLVAIDLSTNAPIEAVPGLLPDMIYTIYVPVKTAGSIPNLTSVGPGVANPLDFSTGNIPNLYFENFFVQNPLVTSTTPVDGEMDVSINTFGDVPGIPEFEQFEIEFDQPLNTNAGNLDGTDLDGDGVRDPNIFLRYSDPLLFAATSGAATDGLLVIDRDDPGADPWGSLLPTTYFGTPVTLSDLVVTPRGRVVALSTGSLFVLDPETGELSNRLDLQLPDLKGLAVSPSGTIYAVERQSGNLIRMPLPDYTPVVVGPVSNSDTVADLSYGYDDNLYLLRQEAGGGPPISIDILDPDDAAATTLFTNINHDFHSFAFIDEDTLCLTEAGTGEFWALSVSSGALDFLGAVPGVGPGVSLDLGIVFFNMEVQPSVLFNGFEGSTLSINPDGILPFDTWIEIVVRNRLENIRFASLSTEEGADPAGFRVAARFCTMDPGSAPLDDTLLEEFEDNDLESRELEMGMAPALWNVQDLDPEPPFIANLLASFGLGGSGELGDFVPQGIFPVILLDTDSQRFPLMDGSTPDIREPLTVTGGRFHFRDITIPADVTIMALGSYPLVLTATGDVTIDGIIDVSGLPGLHDVTFDSGFIPSPSGFGGPGGGRGGQGQPSIPANFQLLKQLETPPGGETGWGYSNLDQSGGRGGETGADDTNITYSGNSPDKNSRGAGGGGGSFLEIGWPGREGLGKYAVGPGQTPYIREGDAGPSGGEPGEAVFVDDDPDNNFFGGLGELQTLIGGQGGGGGGTRWDSLNPNAANAVLGTQWPPCMYDAKGGGSGGGSGSVAIHAIGSITVGTTGQILAIGGEGGGGEMVGASCFGGAGASGSGGAIVLHSGTGIFILGTDADDAARLDVSPGIPADAKEGTGSATAIPADWCKPDGPPHPNQHCSYSRGDGGRGGYGIIQLMVDDPDDPSRFAVSEHAYIGATTLEVDWGNLSPKGWDYYKFEFTAEAFVDPHKTTAELSPESFGLSNWINFGQVIRRPEIQVGPDLLPPPVFLGFEGSDPLTGYIITENGNVVNSGIPDLNDIEVDSPDLGLPDYIDPDNSVRVEFQGANAAVPGSAVPAEPYTSWVTDVTELTGYQFIRFRLTLDVAVSGEPTVDSPRPQVNMFRLRTRY